MYFLLLNIEYFCINVSSKLLKFFFSLIEAGWSTDNQSDHAPFICKIRLF